MDLATNALLSQAVLGRGVRISDPGVADDVQAGIDRVREQVGLSTDPDFGGRPRCCYRCGAAAATLRQHFPL